MQNATGLPRSAVLAAIEFLRDCYRAEIQHDAQKRRYFVTRHRTDEEAAQVTFAEILAVIHPDEAVIIESVVTSRMSVTRTRRLATRLANP